MIATPPDSANHRPLNAVSVDVEDWLQSTIDPRLPLTERFHVNTRKVLEAFARRDVKGTFFVLGLAAEQAPEIVRAIRDAGHEVQSHGYGHELITTLTPERFRADIDRSKKLLEDLIGAPHYPHRLKTPAGGEILEFPVATTKLAGRRLPTGGGGYFRLLPYSILRKGVQQLNDERHSATIYMHPYEFSPDEFDAFDYPISWKVRLHQGLGRRGFPLKVDRMFSEFRFGAMRDVIQSIEDWPTHEHRLSDG
jgi:peptidoglycan/xylan/chitin deacetylase (PgdA/CDA1 family)